jgi:ribosomal protein S12 methylthiotransferase accessory factor
MVTATATNSRHGLVRSLHHARRTFAEPAGVFNVGALDRPADGWQSVAGGIGRSRDAAREAAIGEALERYADHRCALPRRSRAELIEKPILELEDFSLYSDEQRRNPRFPHRELYEGERSYTNVFSVLDNSEVWVPVELVGLGGSGAAVATSSGLAAGPTIVAALTRAVQELVERDALMVTWLHGVPGRRVDLPPPHREEVERQSGDAVCVDATPEYSPHHVALVAGQLPRRGVRRYSLGAACRETWEAAVEKAYLEWLQGVTFIGYYRDFHPALQFRSPRDVKTFDDHAVYYSCRPREWRSLPLFRGPSFARQAGGRSSFRELLAALREGGIRVYYRDLTTSDVRQAGLFVVRALSPELAPIHCHEEWPFLGGTVSDVALRYPWAKEHDLCFVNRYPHPLG